MIDKKTEEFLDKIAAQNSTGTSQMRKQITKTKTRHAGQGAGLGATLGTFSGAAFKGKYKPLAMIAGGLLGAVTGRAIGKRTVSKRKTVTRAGTIKRQEKVKDGEAGIPRLTDSRVLKILERRKK